MDLEVTIKCNACGGIIEEFEVDFGDAMPIIEEHPRLEDGVPCEKAQP